MLKNKTVFILFFVCVCNSFAVETYFSKLTEKEYCNSNNQDKTYCYDNRQKDTFDLKINTIASKYVLCGTMQTDYFIYNDDCIEEVVKNFNVAFDKIKDAASRYEKEQRQFARYSFFILEKIFPSWKATTKILNNTIVENNLLEENLFKLKQQQNLEDIKLDLSIQETELAILFNEISTINLKDNK